MTEPASATLATSTAIATATAATTLLPGIDGNALVGAIAGGALFVTSAHDLPLWRRAVYLVVSVSAGYLAAPDIQPHAPMLSTGVCAFLAGALVVTLATQAIERAKTFDLSSIFTKRGA